MKNANNQKELPSLQKGLARGLEWLPNYEGVLLYDPEDIKEDRPVRLWHYTKHRRFGNKPVLYELKPILRKYGYKGCESDIQRPRLEFHFKRRGNSYNLLRSHVTMLAYMGFAIADRRHWVIDHKDGNTLNDRPSNLQVITQRENCHRSARWQAMQKLNTRDRKLRAQASVDKRERLRKYIIATMEPGATEIDVEIELTMLMEEGYVEGSSIEV